LHVFHPATVTDNHIYLALDFEWNDFEDCVQHIVGESVCADYIVTRNVADFATGFVPAITPERFLETISVTEDRRATSRREGYPVGLRTSQR